MSANLLSLSFVIMAFVFTSACNTTPDKYNDVDVTRVDGKPVDVLYIFEDGKMKFRSRYLNKEDVVIYEDGRGGEKAAVKVRVPRYSDFYRDSIIVVRVENEAEKTVNHN